MHPNPTFRKAERAQNIDFARRRGFGTLSVNGPNGPLAAHVPFLLDADGTVAEAHLARSNPILRAAGPALLAVTGPDGYISPDWYGADDQVPTWNYVAVHLRGRLDVLEPDVLRPHLDALSARHETPLDKRPWTMAKMTPDVATRMMRMIVPVRLHIDAVEGTWKLNQNKKAAHRLAAADAVETGHGTELRHLAAWMRDPPA
ncbi:FMN-binding negative transcriptional regulator [Pontivivens ytuae]|uniref:FMN-binding negative transcriptional regulator n=1 Tax=Pontivivens ytuae TaxID=2789856 RepID=A0A7S9LRP4_9RHOB|nr:FMN-binding negative transcriptional regulator [Pontivivens ytuae]QPH53854.1 FMN-binding negative transcriptional regulator [Pontivivens ytuae]